MSAIWGCIALNNSELPAGIGPRMKHGYEACVIDRFEEKSAPGLLLGCGLQYFTPEAPAETLPVVTETYAFTADVVLDNREEVLQKLGLARQPAPPDGALVLEMYRRYGESCLNQLLGAYAFVFYNRQQNKVSLVLDATGNRCLYFAIQGQMLYFSTLIQPLADVLGCKKVNGRWITHFLALDNLATATEYEETPYDGIYRVAPRQIVTVENGEVSRNTYWQPDFTPLLLENDAAYGEKLLELFDQSVARVLRGDSISIMLSAGMDSTAVGCWAARQLRERNQGLIAFTSVPQKGYVSNKSSYYLVDESNKVLQTKAYLEAEGCQLDCHFLDLPGVNAWDGHKEEMAIRETPYKSLQNALWLREGYKQAYTHKSRIILNGGFGNVGLSAHGVAIYLNTLLQQGHFITFVRQFKRFGKSLGFGHRRMLQRLAQTVWEACTPAKVEKSDEALFGQALVSNAALQQFGVRDEFYKNALKQAQTRKSYLQNRQQVIFDMQFALIGEVQTKRSLYTGVLPRDPTIDKRLLEFLVRLPAGQFARDGVARRLVRTYMKEAMPPHITEPGYIGRQSADTVNRMAPHWGRIQQEIEDIFKRNTNTPYVNCNMALQKLKAINNAEEADEFDVLRLCYTAMSLEFVEEIEHKKQIM